MQSIAVQSNTVQSNTAYVLCQVPTPLEARYQAVVAMEDLKAIYILHGGAVAVH